MNYNRALKTLRKAVELYKDHKLVQHDYAIDKDGHSVSPNSKRAVAYCIQGALQAAGGGLSAWQALDDTLRAEGCVSELATWNDAEGRTKRQVVALLKRTIKRLEKEYGK